MGFHLFVVRVCEHLLALFGVREGGGGFAQFVGDALGGDGVFGGGGGFFEAGGVGGGLCLVVELGGVGGFGRHDGGVVGGVWMVGRVVEGT